MSTIKHAFVSPKPNGSNASLVQPSHWNDDHIFSPPLNGIPIGNSDGSISGISALLEGQYFRRKYNQLTPVYEFASPIQLISTDFHFSLSGQGNLTAGVASTITLALIPSGVTQAALALTKHFIRIIDGAAGNEVIQITSVNAGAKTILVTPTLNHTSGAYTIESATAGIQEAINFLPTTGGSVLVAPGNHNIYEQVTIARDYINIRGCGSSSRILANHNTGAVFYLTGLGNGPGVGVKGWQNSVSNLYIKGPGTPGSLAAIQVRGQLAGRVYDNDIDGVFRGVYVHDVPGGAEPYGVTSAIFIHRNSILNIPPNGVAIHIRGGADHFIFNNHTATGGASTVGILLESTGGSKVMSNEVYGFHNALLIVPGNGLACSNVESIDNWYDSCQDDGVKIVPQGNGFVSELQFANDRIAGCQGTGMSILGTATNILGMSVSDVRFAFNHGNGVAYTGGYDVEFNNCHSYGNSIVSPGTSHGFYIAPNAGNIKINGGTYGQSAQLNANNPNSQGWGILISAGAGDNIIIDGVTVMPNIAGGITNGATGVHNVFRNIIGIDNYPAPNMPSAATITFLGAVYNVVKVTGSVPISTINGGSIGQQKVFIFTAASPGGFITGGNIARAQTALHNQIIVLEYDGTLCY